MGRQVEVAPGVVYQGVPDNVTDAEVRTRAIADGDIPDPGNGFNQFLIGAGKFFADRVPGMDNSTELPGGWQSKVGYAAPSLPAGYLGGASVAGQALIGAGLERTRKGSSWGSTAGQGALSGGITGLTNMAGRVMHGALNAREAARAAQPLLTKGAGGVDDVMARTASGAGGFDMADAINKSVMNRATERAMGLPGNVGKLTEDTLAAARAGISQTYDDALPVKPVAVQAVRDALATIPKEAGPQVQNILKALGDGETIAPAAWQRIHSQLREFRPQLNRSMWTTWTDSLDDALQAMDDAAAASGGDRALLGVANQRFKVLSQVEEINAVLETGDVPAGQLFRKMAAKGWRGFGKRAAGEGHTAGLLPETADLIGIAKTLAAEGRKVAGGSPTAARAALFGPGIVAAGGLVTGQLDPQEAAAMAALGMAPRLMGTALLAPATSSAVSGMAGQAGGQLLGNKLREP